MELISTKHFKKRLNKLVESKKPQFKQKVSNCLLDFSENGKRSKYFRHDMKGKSKELSELQIGGDIRIIVKIIFIKDKAYLLDIGTHSQLNI